MIQETGIAGYEWSSVVPAGAGAGVSVKLLLTAAALLSKSAATGAGGVVLHLGECTVYSVVLHLGECGHCQMDTTEQGLQVSSAPCKI